MSHDVTASTTTVLFHNGVVHADGAPTAVAVEAGVITYVGTADGASSYDGAETVVDLHGALLAPAFVDAHVHTVLTGFGLTRLDLRGTADLTAALDAVSKLAAMQPDGVLVGTGWEEHTWPEGRPPTGAELERAAPGRMVLLERRDCHSCVVSPTLAAAMPALKALDGYDGSGLLEEDARAVATDALADLVGAEQRLVAARAAVQAQAAAGVAAFHEAAAPHLGPSYELDLIRHAAELTGLLPTFYWGDRNGFDSVATLGVVGLAGDLNADGAIGSRTAALRSPYAGQPDNCGHAFLGAQEVADHLVACTRAGIQGGFHCIGEAALDDIADGLRLAEKLIGAEALRAGRHRLEHVEMPSSRLVTAMAELGITASMQPVFDDLWGGPDQMYAERLGERWRGMNPVGAMARAGVRLAFGSDTPVTPIDPWRAVRAAVHHHEESQRIDVATAFDAHTVGGWRAAGIDGVGRIEVGAPAHLAIWDAPAGLAGTLPILAEELPAPGLRTLYVKGVAVGGMGR